MNGQAVKQKDVAQIDVTADPSISLFDSSCNVASLTSGGLRTKSMRTSQYSKRALHNRTITERDPRRKAFLISSNSRVILVSVNGAAIKVREHEPEFGPRVYQKMLTHQ